MGSEFYGLEIAKKTLQAQQLAMNISGHNIANSNTVGYTRQVPKFTQQTSTPVGLFTLPYIKNISSGVVLEEVQRIRDRYLDLQIRQESRRGAYWESMSKGLEQIELIFGEPGESGLSGVFDSFWNSWQELAANPESSAARVLVSETADRLAHAFNDTYRRLVTQQDQLNEEIAIKVAEVNNYLQQIYDINHQIARLGAGGGNINDYRDQLDVLVDKLSQILSVQIKDNDNGTYTLVLQGQILVNSETKNGLSLDVDSVTGLNRVTLGVSGEELNLTYQDGELRALFDLRDERVEEYKGYLDRLAGDLITAVNALHQTGYTLENPPKKGGAFFVGSGASDIAVNPDILVDANKIATSSTGAAGDGSIALAIAELRGERIVDSASATPDDYYRGFISRLGTQRGEVIRLASNQKFLVEELEARKESVSGVSLDEEMTNLIKYQHTYEAASFLVNTIDGMLETLISWMR
ncbi:MAG: flagellar hook-associated protein FlgK [Candidatus Atribacteria bacterium]|nr:flagellar hook-associated protein FlgK [Candidatus Atribacteria bacterium]